MTDAQSTADDALAPRPRLRACVLLGVVVSMVVLPIMLASSAGLGLTWDEGDHIMRIEGIHAWFGSLAGPDRADPFSAEAIERSWRFAREEPHGHPPFFAILEYAGWRLHCWVTGSPGDSLPAYRFGPCLGFAILSGAAAVLVASNFGLLAGLMGSLALVMTPRLFAHGHYTNTDCPLMLMWTLTVCLFAGARASRVARVLFGLCLGLCAITKLTGWFVVVPLLIWTLAYGVAPAVRGVLREGKGLRLFEPAVWLILAGAPLAYVGLRVLPPAQAPFPGPLWLAAPAGVWLVRALWRGLLPRAHWMREPRPLLDTWLAAAALAPLALWAFCPNYWHDPAAGLARFLQSNLSRQQSIPIATWYLGRSYPFSLPWTNTLVLTAATLPVGLLVLALIGAGRTIGQAVRRPVGVLLLLNALFFLVLRALPGVPGHDGVRQFVTAFVFLAMLAGVGAGGLACWRRRKLFGGAVAFLLVAGAAQAVWIHPYPLAYYSETVGGLPGARRLGLETTYYWDSLSPEVLEWMNARPKPTKFAFPTYVRGWAKLHQWGLLDEHVTFEPIARAEQLALRRHVAAGRPAAEWRARPFDFYVLQMRQGSFSEWDWRLAKGAAQPVFSVSRCGVPILAIYRFSDVPEQGRQALLQRQQTLAERLAIGHLGGPKW